MYVICILCVTIMADNKEMSRIEVTDKNYAEHKTIIKRKRNEYDELPEEIIISFKCDQPMDHDGKFCNCDDSDHKVRYDNFIAFTTRNNYVASSDTFRKYEAYKYEIEIFIKEYRDYDGNDKTLFMSVLREVNL